MLINRVTFVDGGELNARDNINPTDLLHLLFNGSVLWAMTAHSLLNFLNVTCLAHLYLNMFCSKSLINHN